MWHSKRSCQTASREKEGRKMYEENLESVAAISVAKSSYLASSRFSYLVASILAGVYVGLGIILIFTVGAPLASASLPVVNLVMGLSFGIALTLVVFAGSELFTGNNMYMMVGLLEKRIGLKDLLKVWSWSWLGNLLGSMGLAALVVASGVMTPQADFVTKIAQAKIQAPLLELFLRGILCNWLVCLALWSSGRAKSESAKCILIFWCLFAFIAAGFEHSVANMTLLPMALFLPHPQGVNFLGFLRNLFTVTMGNIVGGAFFVGVLYWLASRPGKLPKFLVSTPALSKELSLSRW